MTIEFSDKELNCFLKEYVLNETLNINEMMINKFNYFKQDINFKDLIYLVNYILYILFHFIIPIFIIHKRLIFYSFPNNI